MASSADGPLNRSVGALGASFSGIGIVLGAGIYVLISEGADQVGNGVWAAFLIGALFATATGLSYAELSSMIPEAGAAAAYSGEAFGPRAGFVTGWMDVLANSVGAPTVALGFGGYFVGLMGGNPTAIALIAVLLSSLIVLSGITQTIQIAGVFAAIEVLGLLIVIVVGVPFLGDTNVLDISHGLPGFLGAGALVFFAYKGFEEIATLSEEVKDPARNVPRALVVAIAVTASLYVAVALVAVSVVPADLLADAPAPLALVVETASNDRLADALGVVALFATFNTVLLTLATAPRAMYGMANRRMLPAIFGSVWSRRRTPWFGILIASIVALGFTLTGDIGYIAQVSNFGIFVVFMMVNGAVIRLRFTKPHAERSFRLRPEIRGVPLIPVVGLLGILVLVPFMERAAFVTGAVALLVGIALSFVSVRRPARQPEARA